MHATPSLRTMKDPFLWTPSFLTPSFVSPVEYNLAIQVGDMTNTLVERGRRRIDECLGYTRRRHVCMSTRLPSTAGSEATL